MKPRGTRQLWFESNPKRKEDSRVLFTAVLWFVPANLQPSPEEPVTTGLISRRTCDDEEAHFLHKSLSWIRLLSSDMKGGII